MCSSGDFFLKIKHVIIIEFLGKTVFIAFV